MLSPLAWIAIILTLIVAVVVIKLLEKRRKVAPQDEQPIIQPTVVQLSIVEQCCLQTLQQVAGAEFDIRNKVALNRLSSSDAGNSNQVLDFALFSKKSGKPACVIQLKSPAGNEASAMEQALEQANIALYRLPRRSSYSITDMRDLLHAHIEAPPPSPDEMLATLSMRAFRLCKKCHSEMALKRANNGPHKGMLFWVCEGYPDKCSGVELYSE
ncbi:Protein of unknown function (DUF2726) [Mariprofundus aestuarium]|uniref:Uncharacterized protein n=1 Tax=Mariprofundus aestuarium TaxID=1921086 RepID=A0A2K8KYT0_MARES|nr:DUF2726 domain-containing protein [Mariprofundus aestuarium]ATX80083.1 Protein of unknown function (DUF2726) [Mariprofundus aestuarium]